MRSASDLEVIKQDRGNNKTPCTGLQVDEKELERLAQHAE
jgi:hypothetical protein